MTSDWSWRLPTLLQVVGPLVVLVGTPFVHESPRWLIARGKRDQAHKVLAEYVFPPILPRLEAMLTLFHL
jgi:hypothetical protein